MKTRTGFVSNSSTTSFTIYGLSMDAYHDGRELANTIDERLWELKSQGKFDSLTDRFGEECYTFYLGGDWDKLSDDETPAQFKARIKADIEAFLAETGITMPDMQFHKAHEAYRDG